MVTIIPAILATTEEQFKEDLGRVQSAEGLKGGWIHLDFADGELVPNKTVDADVIEDNPIELDIEAHLMVKNPNEWVDSLKNFGVKRVIAHIECDEDIIEDFVSSAKSLGLEVGLAINPDTDIERLDPYFEEVDLILVMGIDPGFQGQPFRQESVEKIKEISEIKKDCDYKFLIGVDGHVNSEDAKVLVRAGADQLVSGSYLLKGDIDENLEKIWETLQ